MSSSQQGGASFSNSSKKAVHVKWAGKTIALGTFGAAEADEKCARAKALTRAWRSSMRPKPSREWVMLELERLGVRVVSGRLGRKAGEEGDDDSERKGQGGGGGISGQLQGIPGQIDRSNSIGWGAGDVELSSLMSRRNSSLGLGAMMGDGRRGSLGSLGQVVGLDADLPPHRPYTGGGSADAFEASRFDHFSQKNAEQQRRSSSLGLGSLGGSALGNMGLSVNPNQHYEMLKLHHMNLLNEIQETTLMMNLYQQQQLQQQQQQLQQQAGADLSADSQMALLLQQNQGGMDMFSSQLQQQRASLGLGVTSIGSNFGTQQNQMHMMQQRNQQQTMPNSSGHLGGMLDSMGGGTKSNNKAKAPKKKATGKKRGGGATNNEATMKRVKAEASSNESSGGDS